MKKVLAVLGALVIIVPSLGLLFLFGSLLPGSSVLIGAGLAVACVLWFVLRKRSGAGGSESSFLRQSSKDGLF